MTFYGFPIKEVLPHDLNRIDALKHWRSSNLEVILLYTQLAVVLGSPLLYQTNTFTYSSISL